MSALGSCFFFFFFLALPVPCFLLPHAAFNLPVFSVIKMGIGKPQSVVGSSGDRSGDLYVLSRTGLERWQVGNGAGCGVVGAQRELRVFCFSN